MTFVCSLYYLLPPALIATIALACYGWLRVATTALACLFALGCAPMREWIGARRFCQVYYETFGVRHNLHPDYVKVMVDEWANGTRYILGMHPHGVIPIQTLVWAAYADQYCRTAEHGTLYGFGGMATILMYMPFMRSIMGWLSGLSADYKTLKAGMTGRVFARPPVGHNLYILPGGIAEIFTAAPGTHAIMWSKRRGLVRLALETGARLTPVYVFGGNDFFHQSLTSDSALARWSRAVGASVTLFWGRWWCPPVPLVPPHGLSIVLAEPLPSTRTAAPDGKPTDAEISALHAAYEESIRALFDKYKVVAGYPDAELKIF